jgi:adenosylhomocysteine nucleosidase
MTRWAVPSNGSRKMAMPRIAIVAALEREVALLIKDARRVEHEHAGRTFKFFERDDAIIVCGGIGLEAARRAAETAIALYHPALLQSVGFAGALQSNLRVGDILAPAVVLDARDGSRTEIADGSGTLLTFMSVAGIDQKARLAESYGAQAVDMEAVAVAAAARVHGIAFRAIKVISDEVSFEIPEMNRFVDSHGRFRTARFAAYAALRPWLWPRIATLSRNSSKAARSLAQYLNDSNRPANHAAEAKTI